MKPGVSLIVAIALVCAPSAFAARAQETDRTSSAGLLQLHRYDHTLIQLERGVSSNRLLLGNAELVSRRLRIWRLRTPEAIRLLPGLLAADHVKLVEPDRPLQTAAAQVDPLSGHQWWRAAVGADRVSPPGPGKPLTIIDAGIFSGHPEFAGRANTILLNEQRLDESAGEYHGTAVSSVAAAPENGVGIVGVYPQVVLRSWDAGPPTVSRVIQGIEAAIDAGAGVINLSLGFSERDRLLEQAVLVAFGTGSVIVAAAGNEREVGNPRTFPANLNHVLTVAATDQSGRVTGFSTSSVGVDLAAPGVDIPAATPPDDYVLADGTSFASPIVAGATAWVWTARRQLDQTQVFDLMRFSARDVGEEGWDPDTGYGVLDIPAALSQRAPTSDHQEPNDDIPHVKANGLFREASRPLTAPSRGRATLSARMDITEDPEDVYRVWVPAGRVVRITVTPDTDVDVDFWDGTTTSVFLRGTARRRHLLGASARRGRVAERVTIGNRGRHGFFGYLDVFLRRGGPLDAGYRVNVATAQR